MSISFGDFCPINTWEPDTKGQKWSNGEPQMLIDKTTGKHYLNEYKHVVAIKCFLLTIGTPVVHSIVSLVNVAYKIIKLISFSHFWEEREEEKSYSLKGRLQEAGQDFLRVLTTPLALMGLELAAFYGLFTPYNGRKLYASIERAQYGHFILAPCFQPRPQFHAFGGDMNEQNAF